MAPLTGPVITAGLQEQDSAETAPASPAVLIFLELQPRAPWSVHTDVKALILRRKHLLLRVMYWEDEHQDGSTCIFTSLRTKIRS